MRWRLPAGLARAEWLRIAVSEVGWSGAENRGGKAHRADLVGASTVEDATAGLVRGLGARKAGGRAGHQGRTLPDGPAPAVPACPLPADADLLGLGSLVRGMQLFHQHERVVRAPSPDAKSGDRHQRRPQLTGPILAPEPFAHAGLSAGRSGLRRLPSIVPAVPDRPLPSCAALASPLLAGLELTREGKILLTQRELFGPITLDACGVRNDGVQDAA